MWLRRLVIPRSDPMGWPSRTLLRRGLRVTASAHGCLVGTEASQSSSLSSWPPRLLPPPTATRSRFSRALSSQSPKAPDIWSLRNIIKPFLLKCHPDVHPSASTKRINLQAVQNLNSYIDTVESAMSHRAGASRVLPSDSQQRTVEIDFILPLSDHEDGNKNKASRRSSPLLTARRAVQLRLPACDAHGRPPPTLHQFAARELVKLLTVAGLPAPAVDVRMDVERQVDVLEYWGIRPSQGNDEEEEEDRGLRRPHHESLRSARRPKTKHELRRERFLSTIDWNKVNQLYREAVADMEADIRTQGSVGKHANRRRRFIAAILANVTVQEELDMMEQLIAFRRLSLLLEQHYDTLHMEDFGRYWETCRIVLGPSRQYNVSASALHKRRLRSGDNGFSFTLHADYHVSIVVPVDFRDEELIQELEANLWDFYNIVGDGLDDIYRDEAL